MASPTVHCKITIPFDIYLSSRCHCAARCLGNFGIVTRLQPYLARVMCQVTTPPSPAQYSLDTFVLCNNMYIIYSPNLEQHLDKYIYLSILSFVLYTLCISNVFSATLSSLFDLIKVYLL